MSTSRPIGRPPIDLEPYRVCNPPLLLALGPCALTELAGVKEEITALHEAKATIENIVSRINEAHPDIHVSRTKLTKTLRDWNLTRKGQLKRRATRSATPPASRQRQRHDDLDFTLQVGEKIVIAFDLYGTILSTESIVDELSKQFGEASAKTIAAQWRRFQLEYSWRISTMGKMGIVRGDMSSYFSEIPSRDISGL